MRKRNASSTQAQRKYNANSVAIITIKLHISMGINKQEKQEFKLLLGYNYAKQFQSFLEDKGLLNKNGNSYSAGHIRTYFSVNTNGSNPLDSIFIEFWEYISKQKENKNNKLKKLSKRTKSFLY